MRQRQSHCTTGQALSAYSTERAPFSKTSRVDSRDRELNQNFCSGSTSPKIAALSALSSGSALFVHKAKATYINLQAMNVER